MDNKSKALLLTITVPVWFPFVFIFLIPSVIFYDIYKFILSLLDKGVNK
jgi:hypothetical protein